MAVRRAFFFNAELAMSNKGARENMQKMISRPKILLGCAAMKLAGKEERF